MRTIRYTTLLLMLILSISTGAAAQMDTKTPIDITVNGKYILFDVSPFMISGTTYVPVRFISGALGAERVSWNEGERTAVIEFGGRTLALPTGENHAYLDGRYMNMNGGAILYRDRTFVPVRFIAETMGADVLWKGDCFTVAITRQGINVPDSLVWERGFDDIDLYWMARVIEAEASGESFEGKLAVGAVVINRVASSEYPNTVYGVIFDRMHGVQFEPVINGTIHNNPSYDSLVAAKRSLMGENNIGKCLYFFNPRIAESTWIARNRVYSLSIGNHDFYL